METKPRTGKQIDFEKDEKFRKEYQEYLKNEYRKRPGPRD